MHTEVFTALIGLIGIALGALFGGVGYYLKSRVERLRNKKMVLYHLLEFRHQILSSYANPKDFANEYFNICNSYLKKIGLRSEEGIPEVSGYISQLDDKFFKANKKISARLFISYGQNESAPFVASVSEFQNKIKNRKDSNLQLMVYSAENMAHAGTKASAYAQGLVWAWKDIQP